MARSRSGLVVVGVALAGAAASCGGAPATTATEGAELPSPAAPAAPRTGGPMAPEPDYAEVMAREFRAAEAKGTPEALIRFIARHPGHPLADEARSRVYSARGNPLPAWRPSGGAGPDADIYTAFYRALRADTTEAYDAFIRRFAPHPLVGEAQSLRSARERGSR